MTWWQALLTVIVVCGAGAAFVLWAAAHGAVVMSREGAADVQSGRFDK